MRPFEIGPGHTGYNLDRCEEIILMDAWLKIRGRIGPEENWKTDFEEKLFRTDKGVSGRYLEAIERHLKRLHLEPLGFQPTEWSDYMRIRYNERIESRSQILDDLRTGDRKAILLNARHEQRVLQPLIAQAEQPAVDPVEEARRRKEDALERARVSRAETAQEIAGVKEAAVALAAAVREMAKMFSGLGALAEKSGAAIDGLESRLDALAKQVADMEGAHLGAENAQTHERREVKKQVVREVVAQIATPRVDLPGAEQPDISHLNGHAFAVHSYPQSRYHKRKPQAVS